MILDGSEVARQQLPRGLSHLVELAHRGELAGQVQPFPGAREGHHGDLVGGVAGRLGAVNALARRHQEGLVIAEGHHQIALAGAVQGLEQALEGSHGIHHPGVVGVEQLGIRRALIRAGSVDLLGPVAIPVEGAVPLHGNGVGKEGAVVLVAAF